MAEAAAKSVEHTLLLSLLLAPPSTLSTAAAAAAKPTPAPKVTQRAGAGKGAAATPSPPAEPLPTYRYGHTQGYELLPAARVKAGEAGTRSAYLGMRAAHAPVQTF